ncbi:GNAT family N-acetyltransferase [Kouleothrix sp.]|uniref:GNAT family N-acetyltransferase n=1 Tax=Kouleothrix sp. TaxID=2779161 RepID=UPI003918F97C
MASAHVTIHEATAGNLRALAALIGGAGLGTNDLLAPGSRYWLALDGERVPVGAIGAEYGADAVLLRSAAVRAAARGQGIGAALLAHALGEARRQGCARAYLFSTDAGAFWARMGFREVPVPELVAALPAAPQVRHYDALGWLPTEVAWRIDL